MIQTPKAASQPSATVRTRNAHSHNVNLRGEHTELADLKSLGQPAEGGPDGSDHGGNQASNGPSVASLRRPDKQQIPAALQERCEALRKLRDDNNRHDVKARYAFGKIVLEVRTNKNKVYGDDPVGQILAILHEDKDKLSRAAGVAKTFSEEEFKALRCRKRADGKFLSWSHCVELSKVTAKHNRNRLIKRACDECLSVRKLKNAIDEDQDSQPSNSKTSTQLDRGAASGLREMAAMSGLLEKKVQRWDSAVFEYLSRVEDELTPKQVEQLEEALAASNALAKIGNDNAKRLGQVLKSRRLKVIDSIVQKSSRSETSS